VYALLGPCDRNALRRSLPPQMLRRLSWPLIHDQQLLSLDYAFQHGLVDDALSPTVFRFLAKHARDPAVMAMARRHGLELDGAVGAKGKECGAVDNLLACIRLDAVTPADLELLTYADMEDHVSFFKLVMELCRSKPATFDAVLADARVSRAFDEPRHSHLWINFLGHVVNALNEPLLTHVLGLPIRFVGSALQHLRKPETARLFADRADMVGLLLKHCDLSPDARAAIMRAAVNTYLNADVVELLAGVSF
jgi:hypothetical protein